MRKFNSSTPSSNGKDDTLLGAVGGERVSDSAVVGEIHGQKITAGEVREAEEFAALLDRLVELRNYVAQHPEDEEAFERFILSAQQVVKDNHAAFTDMALGLWQMFRQSTAG